MKAAYIPRAKRRGVYASKRPVALVTTTGQTLQLTLKEAHTLQEELLRAVIRASIEEEQSAEAR